MKTLEDILQSLGSEKPFLEDVESYDDGSKNPFTDSGSKAYSKLIDILYTVGTLTHTDMNDVVEELDSICNEEM